MNRRIVIVDQFETPNFVQYYSCCKNDEIYTIQALESNCESKRNEILKLERGDGVMLVGSEPFKYLRQFYHYGVRGEGFVDCSKLYRLSIEGGAFVRVVSEFPDEFLIEDFLSDDFVRPIQFPEFRQAVLSTYDEACRFLDWVDKFPLDQDYGFDYEGSGMPLDKWYELSGFSISTETFSGFVSLTDIRHEIGTTDGRYNSLLKKLGAWLIKRMGHVWTYNMQYEFQVSNRMLGVDAYNLCDSSVVNTLDGFHMAYYSLKWTAQRVLGVDTWDIEFDKISDLIDAMLFTEVGQLKKDKKKVLKVTQDNFDQTPEWKVLMQRYPDFEEEFRSLILEYWGNPFMCIPSKILGFYCNLDAFYTLMIYKKKQNTYSKDCWEVNLDNIRLGCRLMAGGLYIDEPYRAKYEHYCKQMMAWGITYCAQMRCHYKMDAHKSKAANLKNYNSVAITLLNENKFYNGNEVEIVKNLMADNIDLTDSTETGLDEGAISMKYGDDFAGKFVDIVKDAMIEVKMKEKIDAGIIRKKKILGIIAEKSKPLFGLDTLKLGPKHIELEKYLYYERAYNELRKVCSNQLTDIYNIPDKIYAFGRTWDLLEYSDFVTENYFKCKSPLENDEIVYDLTMLLRPQTSFLAAMSESIQQLPETKDFYKSRGISNIGDGFVEFSKELQNWIDDGNYVSNLYPEKVFTLFKTHYESPKKTKVAKRNSFTFEYSCSDKVKDMWTDFAGFNIQTSLFSDYKNQDVEYGKQYDPSDRNDIFFFMRKVTINYLLYKKYAKLLSTYVGSDGMFKKNNRYVIEGPNHIPIRYAEPDEPGAVEKCFVRYEVQKKSSKRWSSGFHTIISHGDLKDVLCPPPAWDENGNIIYGGSDKILTYFDIKQKLVSPRSDSRKIIYLIVWKILIGNAKDNQQGSV